MPGTIATPGSRLIFMKVGVHARETIEEIVERKKQELTDEGLIFWGYGGGTCHPLTFVQPFAKQATSNNGEVKLVMEKMVSRHFAEPKLAREYSDDGVNWKLIPSGIQVRGSRYAMILNSFEETDSALDLSQVKVALGPCRGRMGSDYVKGRVDKACFEVPREANTESPPAIKQIDLVARLAAPYAVFVR